MKVFAKYVKERENLLHTLRIYSQDNVKKRKRKQCKAWHNQIRRVSRRREKKLLISGNIKCKFRMGFGGGAKVGNKKREKWWLIMTVNILKGSSQSRNWNSFDNNRLSMSFGMI